MNQTRTVITSRRWRGINPRELWNYRSLAGTLVLRDIKVRYKQTVLGFAWAFIRPLAMLAVFSFVFQGLADVPSDGQPYPVFLFAALLPWNLFSASLLSTTGSLVGSAPLVAKIYFPRLLIPISSLGSLYVDATISSVLLLVLMVVFDVPLHFGLVFLPVILALAALVALSLGLGLAALAVSYRDVAQVAPFLVQLGMFLTPVVYPSGSIPAGWEWLFQLNPMLGLIDLSRAVIFQQPLDWVAVLTAVGVTLVMLTVSLLYFANAEHRFADVI